MHVNNLLHNNFGVEISTINFEDVKKIKKFFKLSSADISCIKNFVVLINKIPNIETIRKLAKDADDEDVIIIEIKIVNTLNHFS